MDCTFMPAPYKGVNELFPVAVIKPPYCQTLLNFNPTANGIVLRNGDSIYQKVTTVGNSSPLGLFTYGANGGIFAAFQNDSTGVVKIYNVDTGAVVYTSAAAPFATILYSTFFDGTLFIYGPTDTVLAPGIKYDGTSWAAVAYTGAGNFYPIAGNTFNHRQYMPQKGEAAYWYTPIDSPASGVCTKVDLTGIFSEKCEIVTIASTTISDNISAVVYQAFVADTGEVLFYTGSYPDGNDWNLVGRAWVSQPVDYGATIPFNGDTLLITDAGVVSLRDLFLRGSQEASTLALSSEAQKTWVMLVQGLRLGNGVPVGPVSKRLGWRKVVGVFDSANSRIVISFPVYAFIPTSTAPGNYYCIFDTQLLSWFFHVSGGIPGFGSTVLFNADMVLYKNKLTILSPSGAGSTAHAVRVKEGRSGSSISYMDKDLDDVTEIRYPYETKLAPIPFKKDAVYTVEGVEVLILSDLYAATNYNLVADFGRQTTANQVVTGLTTSVQKPMVNIGLTANFAQVKVSGETVTGKTVGLEIYGFNVWFESGEKGSR